MVTYFRVFFNAYNSNCVNVYWWEIFNVEFFTTHRTKRKKEKLVVANELKMWRSSIIATRHPFVSLMWENISTTITATNEIPKRR